MEMLFNNFVIIYKLVFYLIIVILLWFLVILRVVIRFRSYNVDLCVKYWLYEYCNIVRVK